MFKKIYSKMEICWFLEDLRAEFIAGISRKKEEHNMKESDPKQHFTEDEMFQIYLNAVYNVRNVQ